MIKSFRGGVHPNGNKVYTSDKSIEIAPVPDKVIIPVRQHIGAPASPLVEKGDEVKKGQLIAASGGFISSNIHASISGKVIDVGNYPHPTFGVCTAIVIENDGKDEWIEGIPTTRNFEDLNESDILEIIKENGVVGMGGATFPTHVKLSPPKDKKIDVFILNAAECEPYLTADHRAMIEYQDKITTGVKIVMKILKPEKCYIGIENNKPDSIKSMKQTFSDISNVQVVSLPTKYPQGAEKMLIKVLTGREVPSGGLPADVGVVVQNVGTLIAISDAVERGIPLIQRITTVSGGAINSPKNLLVRIGTSFSDAINFCGGFSKDPVKIIMGGPMMGFAESNLDIPIIKGVSGILALTKNEVNSGRESPCIRCGRCIQACPMGLNPSMLSILGQNDLYKEAKDEYNLLDCVECGSCVYSCPAKRNIVQYIKYSKAKNAEEAKILNNKISAKEADTKGVEAKTSVEK
ncbi:electron transport complex subunit RsxC [Clostridium tyrobutyricum]|uniref:Ion-translocating oxidoreductase complex subunit C n=1 Tax=Clostridium tyrobutyricum DIVETGP TaxID=1408889 RepID=W6NAQ8_CLOTY|nr:electron transport complex subunit RsxC [Clostridium tyrobutyricum]AND84564.1 electron transport complex protein RnfC [Clostridium tyrobutyricum]ANP69174.1 electron transporter RnfC [Clostridium tyrobutyricum]MBR9648987.1 electron transport complex subunit RsxC [Clostridium tyrobutyricum]MBV4415551.1 electron transport complex subunit RsxC [Clostridium tyrobutyricum]MBV4421368.1 electron transport complex subunit RsxC [Clostridium tyrobutyricum]